MATKRQGVRERLAAATFMTTHEAARELATDGNYVRRLLADGKLRGRKRQGEGGVETQEWEVERTSVEAYKKMRRLMAAAKASVSTGRER